MENDDSAALRVSRIPLTLLITLVIQAAGVLIWATQLDARVNSVELQSISSGSANEKFARLEERLENMRQDIDIIRRQLDRLTERLLKR